jgi:sulfatase maturation enzyme AslB (radical SAM superfamily)
MELTGLADAGDRRTHVGLRFFDNSPSSGNTLMTSSMAAIAQYAPVAFSNGLTALCQYGHVKMGARISRPNMIYLTINERCNLRCKYCYS